MNYKNISMMLFVFMTTALITQHMNGMECTKIPAPKDLYNLGLVELNGYSFQVPPLVETKVTVEDLFKAERYMDLIYFTRLHRHFVDRAQTGITEAQAQENPPLEIIPINKNNKRKSTDEDETITNEQDQTKRPRQTVESSSNDSSLLDYIHMGEVETIQHMIETGQIRNVDLEIQGHSLLHYALRSKELAVEMIQMLTQKGASVDLNNKKGSTPLHIACRTTSEKVIALLNAGAKVNIPNRQGNYPIHIAVAMGRIKILQCLLEHQNGGFDQLEFKDAKGFSPLKLAQQKYAHNKKRRSIIGILSEAQKKLQNQKAKSSQNYQNPLLYASLTQCVRPITDASSKTRFFH